MTWTGNGLINRGGVSRSEFELSTLEVRFPKHLDSKKKVLRLQNHQVGQTRSSRRLALQAVDDLLYVNMQTYRHFNAC